MRFLDRDEAGVHLARALLAHRTPDALVLALPHGGVPVGWQVARLLAIPFEVIVARKVCVPDVPAMGLGAVAEGGVREVNLGMARTLGVKPDALAEAVRQAEAEVARRVALYRAGRGLPRLEGRTVLLVDELIARGAKMRVAVKALRACGVGRVVVAAPVAAASVAALLAARADAVVALIRPASVSGAAEWYERAEPVEDARVLEILARPLRAAETEAAAF